MKAYTSFIILIASFVLWVLPVTTAVYDFRTDFREDTFSYNTGVGVTTANVTLIKPIYNNDTSTLALSSNLTTDSPTFSVYNTTNRSLLMTGITENATRTLTVGYDVTALTGATALNTFMDWFPYIWYVILLAFPIGGLAAIWWGK